MATVGFDRDAMANWYAEQHRKTDPGVRQVIYLPKDAPEREIRFVEVNDLIAERKDDELEPLDFGVDTGEETEHKLFVMDVTPGQWEKIADHLLQLPDGWSLIDRVSFPPEQS